jgi:hypothetical protein
MPYLSEEEPPISPKLLAEQPSSFPVYGEGEEVRVGVVRGVFSEFRV